MWFKKTEKVLRLVRERERERERERDEALAPGWWVVQVCFWILL